MRATFTQDQSDIEKTVRSLAESGRVRARSCLDEGWIPLPEDAVLLRDFSQLGVPEAAGGIGSSLIDLLVAVEALGRQVVPSPFPAHAAALQLALDAGFGLDDALAGTTRWAPAVDEPRLSGWDDLRSTVADPVLKTLVPYAAGADAFIVLHADGVSMTSAEQTVARVSLDPSRPLSDVLPSVEMAASGPAGSGVQRATLVAAAELCGLAQGALAMGAAHARSRMQFGRIIGSFQGVAFQLADAAAASKAAWDLTLHAAWAVEHGRPEAEMQVHGAKAAAGKAAVFSAERCIQVHGGMGITREADPHLYLRRAMVLDAWLGAGSWHRRRVGTLRIAAAS